MHFSKVPSIHLPHYTAIFLRCLAAFIQRKQRFSSIKCECISLKNDTRMVLLWDVNKKINSK